MKIGFIYLNLRKIQLSNLWNFFKSTKFYKFDFDDSLNDDDVNQSISDVNW